MSIKVDNAIILAAGYASRFRPLSDICPKALLPVKGEVLIERQIHQLLEAEVPAIYIVVGYKQELFSYLADKYPQVTLIENPYYRERNNHYSLYVARQYIRNSYLCSADNYFPVNPFSSREERPYYSALYASGPTDEYCLTTDADNRITNVVIGGADSWYMLGHVFVDADFSRTFLPILEELCPLEATHPLLWEQIYMEHIDTLTLFMRPYPDGSILEFDSLDDLKKYDSFYASHTTADLLEYFSQL